MATTIVLIVVALLVVAVAVVLIIATRQPDIFQVQRSTGIKAAPEKIFPLINEFRNWGSWSPYEHRDPAMKRSFSGAASGKGAVYEWEGNSNVGTGRIEITDSIPTSKVMINLDMLKPFEAHNKVQFTLEPRGGTTTVTWAMAGRTPFMAKIMHVFMNMDRMVGGDFEAGLASMKAISEK